MADPDIDWTAFNGIEGHSALAGIDGHVTPEVAIASYVCNGCGKAHVFINTATDNMQMAIGLNPEMARNIAFALVAAADRVAPQGRN